MTEPKHFLIDKTGAGTRLDAWLPPKVGISRERVQTSIETGLCTVNGAAAKIRYKLKVGDHVVFTEPPLPLTQALPETIPLQIVYRDEHFLVVEKEAGMVVHPAPGHEGGTLVNALLGMGLFATQAGDLRPGIVHRIDKDTSGLLLVTLTEPAREKFAALFAKHHLTRSYLAIASGRVTPDDGTFDTLHGRHPTCRLRFSSRVDKGKRAITHYRVLQHFGAFATLVKATLETGRTHQVRVHFHDAGHSLLGDPLYKGNPPDLRVRELAQKLGRQALHAAELGFVHPFSGEKMHFTSNPPEDFQKTLQALDELNRED